MTRFLLTSSLALCLGIDWLHAESKQSAPIPAEKFAEYHSMFKTQPGESLFWELPWMIQLDEALKKGAAEGKPIFIWCGAGGAPVGVC